MARSRRCQLRNRLARAPPGLRGTSLAPARTRCTRGSSREGAPGTVGRRASRAAARGRVDSVGGEGKVSEERKRTTGAEPREGGSAERRSRRREMVHWGGPFDRAGGGDDDIVSIAPSTSTLAGDDDARVGARRHHDSPPRDLSRHHQIPPSTSRSHRSGLSDGGSTRPFRASVSAPNARGARARSPSSSRATAPRASGSSASTRHSYHPPTNAATRWDPLWSSGASTRRGCASARVPPGRRGMRTLTPLTRATHPATRIPGFDGCR